MAEVRGTFIRSFPALMTLAMSGATAEDAGLASGLVNTSQQMGGALRRIRTGGFLRRSAGAEACSANLEHARDPSLSLRSV